MYGCTREAPGWQFFGSTNLVLGGPNAGDGNVFDSGLSLSGCSGVTIQGNFIGVDTLGTNLGSRHDGIQIDATSSADTFGLLAQ